MSFFDKKEEVLDIQLTQFGKQLLSMGKFKPAYYAFFDDDILYDSEYGGTDENRALAGDRIRNETPNTKVQYVYSGIETNFEKAKQLIRMDREPLSQQLQPTVEKHYALSAPLGNSSLSEENSPAWNISFLKGEISGTVEYKSGKHATLRIPQIQTETVKYYTYAVYSDNIDNEDALLDINDPDGEDAVKPPILVDELPPNSAGNFTSLSSRFEDGSSISVESDFILISVDEQNTDLLKENFDIEVFIEETDPSTGQEVYTQLFFEEKCRLVDDNNILLDEEQFEPAEFEINDPSFVNHFFHVYVDDEIGQDVLCGLVPPKERETMFPANFFDCEDIDGAIVSEDIQQDEDLYITDVTEDDVDEDCQ